VTSATGYEGLASFRGPLPKVEQVSYEASGRQIATLAARPGHSGTPAQMRFFGTE
jgi:hypothetical protein